MPVWSQTGILVACRYRAPQSTLDSIRATDRQEKEVQGRGGGVGVACRSSRTVICVVLMYLEVKNLRCCYRNEESR